MSSSKRNSSLIIRIVSFLKSRFVQFSGVGLSGVVLQMTMLTLMHNSFNWPFFLAQPASVVVTMISNYSLNNAITFREKRLRGSSWFLGLVSFALACSIGALFNLVAAQLAFKLGAHWIVAGLAGTAVGSVFNYVSVDRYTWKTATSPAQTRHPAGLPSPASRAAARDRQRRRDLP